MEIEMNEDQLQIYHDESACKADLRAVIDDMEQENEVLRLRLADVVEWNNCLVAGTVVGELEQMDALALEVTHECGFGVGFDYDMVKLMRRYRAALNIDAQLNQAKVDALREAAAWFAMDGNYGNPAFVLMKMAAELEKP